MYYLKFDSEIQRMLFLSSSLLVMFFMSSKISLGVFVDVAEGRMQAYGWSLPAKYSTEVAEGGKSLVSVPVPVYCRPLNLNDPGMKVSFVFQISRYFMLNKCCNVLF